MDPRAPDPRVPFALAAQGFVAVAESVRPEDWARPALGVWTVRDLTGHTGRALQTVELYLDPGAGESTPDLTGPTEYYARAAAALADPAAVAERGRQAGAALGDDPASTVVSMAHRVVALVDDSAEHALVRTPVGTIRLRDYLPTRTFELVVHSLDLAAAVGAAVPDVLRGPVGTCLHLAADLASVRGDGPDVLLALTGRRSLPDGFSVV